MSIERYFWCSSSDASLVAPLTMKSPPVRNCSSESARHFYQRHPRDVYNQSRFSSGDASRSSSKPPRFSVLRGGQCSGGGGLSHTCAGP